jgi:hypothetical protein
MLGYYLKATEQEETLSPEELALSQQLRNHISLYGNGIYFFYGRDGEAIFELKPGEPPRIAVTYPTPEGVVFINKDLFKVSSLRPVEGRALSLPETLNLLVHEIGHKVGMTGEPQVDSLAAKVEEFSEKRADTIVVPLPEGKEIIITSFGVDHDYKKALAANRRASIWDTLLVNDGERAIDLMDSLRHELRPEVHYMKSVGPVFADNLIFQSLVWDSEREEGTLRFSAKLEYVMHSHSAVMGHRRFLRWLTVTLPLVASKEESSQIVIGDKRDILFKRESYEETRPFDHRVVSAHRRGKRLEVEIETELNEIAKAQATIVLASASEAEETPRFEIRLTASDLVLERGHLKLLFDLPFGPEESHETFSLKKITLSNSDRLIAAYPTQRPEFFAPKRPEKRPVIEEVWVKRGEQLLECGKDVPVDSPRLSLVLRGENLTNLEELRVLISYEWTTSGVTSLPPDALRDYDWDYRRASISRTLEAKRESITSLPNGDISIELRLPRPEAGSTSWQNPPKFQIRNIEALGSKWQRATWTPKQPFTLRAMAPSRCREEIEKAVSAWIDMLI